MKAQTALLTFALVTGSAIAKLPPLSDEAKAKAAEAAAKTAWTEKVGAYKLCQSMDRVAAGYLERSRTEGKEVAPVATPPCADPGPFAYVPADPKPIEAAGAHSPPQTAATPPSTTQPAAAGTKPLTDCVTAPDGDAAGFEAAPGCTPLPNAPRMTQAGVPLLRSIEILDQHGVRRDIQIPAERPLTVFIDKRELVTLMTLGARPELLVLGYLLNQRLIGQLDEVTAISVDWEVDAAAVSTRAGIADLAERTAHRTVTTGCGQGTVFGDAMEAIDAIRLPDAQAARITQAQLLALLDSLRQRDSVHRRAGSVHGCALFEGARMLVFAEDVGRHNAIDTIAGWMLVHGVGGADKVFFTTGRLTSEMVIKAAQMGVPIVVSRNGVTAMGHDLATRLGMTLFGRAANRHFLCYTGFERFDAEPEPAGPAAH